MHKDNKQDNLLQKLFLMGIKRFQSWSSTDFGPMELEDFVQEAVIIFYLKSSTSPERIQSPDSYFLGILKKILLKEWDNKKKGKFTASHLPGFLKDQPDISLALDREREIIETLRKTQKVMKEVFAQMANWGNGDCEELLRASYLSDNSIASIAKLLNKKYDSFRVKLVRCRAKFQSLFKAHPLASSLNLGYKYA